MIGLHVTGRQPIMSAGSSYVRNIGRFEDQARAQVLSDYLYAEGIDNRVEEAEPGWAIWVHDDARVAEAKAHLADFHSFPSDARFEKARAVAQARRKEHEQKDAAYRQRVRLAQLSMHGAQARGDLTRLRWSSRCWLRCCRGAVATC